MRTRQQELARYEELALRNPEFLKLALRGRRARPAAAAASDINQFIQYVYRDEETGALTVQAELHKRWHRLADQHKRLQIWAAVEHGKTSQMSIARTLWTLGKRPATRVAIVSNTGDQSGKIIRTLASYIESSDALHEVFPHLRRSRRKNDPWHSSALVIDRPNIAKEPSVQAFGVHGNVTGARIDLLILDDVLDYENCRTPGMRDDLYNWYHATLAGRLTADAQVISIGTAYHPDDLMHRLARNSLVWTSERFPVYKNDGSPQWPERWPLHRIAAKRQELIHRPVEFARQMLCRAQDSATAIFKPEWIATALHRGMGRTMAAKIAHLPAGFATYTGVDLAVSRKDSADKTVLFTILVHPDESRELLEIQSGRWAGEDIIRRIIDSHRRFQTARVTVENNAAQDFIVQAVKDRSAVPVFPFTTTGQNKSNPEYGVQSLATEFANGKWIIPSADGSRGLTDEVEDWIRSMVYYAPDSHTGDELMAAWFAREGARAGVIRSSTGLLPLTAR